MLNNKEKQYLLNLVSSLSSRKLSEEEKELLKSIKEKLNMSAYTVVQTKKKITFAELKDVFDEQGTNYPIILAYGYTHDGDRIRIILFEDSISRIVSNYDDKVLNREDMYFDDDIHFQMLVKPHKRMYPNTVNPIFKEMCEMYDVWFDMTLPLDDTNIEIIY